MRNLTVNELFAEADSVCNWLITERGYDSASTKWITIHESSINFYLSYEDDFQKDAEHSQRYHSTSGDSIRIANDSNLWEWAASLPTRRQRETAFIIRQLRPIASAAEQVKDLEIQEIIQGILGANVSLHNLLEHKVGAPKLDDEIPF